MTEIHLISCGNVNCYIIAENKNALLVDTGREKYREKVLEKCREFHVNLLVLTHGHVDHCQNAAYLARALQVPIAMSGRDRNLIADNKSQPLSAKTFLGKIVLAASLSSFEKDRIEAFEPEILVRDGDSLKEFGVDAQVVDLPGHTRGSVGIRAGEGLLVGDALMNMFYPTVSMLYTDADRMLESAGKISGMGRLKICFGHGKPVENLVWGRAQ